MSDRLERGLQIGVFLGALVTVPLIIAQERGVESIAVVVADWIVWGIFLIEYVIMLSITSNRWRYVRAHLLDAAVVVLSFPLLPAVLGLARLTRLVRVARLLRLGTVALRGVNALRMVLGRAGMVYVGSVAGFLIIGAAATMSVLEPESAYGGFADGLWWAIVTVTTVGYGDISPSTVQGRLVGVVLMLVGVGLISTLSGSVTAYFISEDTEDDHEALSARLTRIEALLVELRDKENRPTRDS